MDQAQIKQLKDRVEEELRQRELAFLDFWLQELKNLLAKRHRELAALQSDLKAFSNRMETRVRTLRQGGR